MCLSNLKDQKDDDRLLLLGLEQMLYLRSLVYSILYTDTHLNLWHVVFVLTDNYIKHMKSVPSLSRTLLFSSLKILQAAGFAFPSQKDAERIRKRNAVWVHKVNFSEYCEC